MTNISNINNIIFRAIVLLTLFTMDAFSIEYLPKYIGVADLTKNEIKTYAHIKKIPIAFANYGDDFVKYHTYHEGKVCKNARDKNNSVQLKFTKSDDQINFAVKCLVLGRDFDTHLRVYATDELAAWHCGEQGKRAYYRGKAIMSADPAGRVGQLVGLVYTLGLTSNKAHVTAAYVCGLKKDPDVLYNNYAKIFKAKPLKAACEMLTDPTNGSMLEFDDIKTSVHKAYFSLNESECKKLTGRYTSAELNEIAIQEEKEKKAREMQIAKIEAEEKEKKRLAILERKRLDKIEIDRISKLGNKELCYESLSDNGDLKSIDGVNKFQIEEVNKRKISQNECRQITGMYPEEVLARMQKREECEEMGFKDSEKIADCILRLIEAEALIKSKEIESAENNKLLTEQNKLDKTLEDQMAQFEIEQKKLDVLLKQLEQAESQTAAAQEQAAAARAQAAAAAASASEAKKANRREGLKEAERQMKKGSCMLNNYDFWNC